MRLIGKSELYALAETKDRELVQAVRALGAELEAADWHSLDNVLTAFPRAQLCEHRVTIDLDELNCAVIALNFEVGIALVEFAGPKSTPHPAIRKTEGLQ